MRKCLRTLQNELKEQFHKTLKTGEPAWLYEELKVPVEKKLSTVKAEMLKQLQSEDNSSGTVDRAVGRLLAVLDQDSSLPKRTTECEGSRRPSRG